MTEDELHIALLEGEKSGIVESKERSMVEGVFYLGDRPVGTFMTHRSEIVW
jgi:putative hemolysin